MPYPPSPRTCPYHIGVLEAIHIGDATRCDERSAVRVARRRRTDMVMQASMWVLGVAAVERQLCRSEPTAVRHGWPTAIRRSPCLQSTTPCSRATSRCADVASSPSWLTSAAVATRTLRPLAEKEHALRWYVSTKVLRWFVSTKVLGARY